MILPWARNRIHPGEQVFACPACGSTDPATPILLLANWVRRKGRIVGVMTGQSAQCRRCGCEYDITPSGVYRIASFAPPVPNTDWSGQRTRVDEVERPARPMPKEKPPV